jgi:heptosyltransferase-2
MLKLIDEACFPFCYLVKHIRQILPKKEGKNIAIIKFSGMGEAVLTLPAIKELKKRGYEIDAIVLKKRAGIVYEHCPMVRKVKYLTSAKMIKELGQYARAFDFELFSNTSAIITALLSRESYGFSHSHRAEAYKHIISFDETHVANNYLHLVGSKERAVFPDPNLISIPKYVEERIVEWLKQWKKEAIIGIHASTEHTCHQRRWPFFAELIKRLVKKDVAIVLTGKGKEDEKINAKIIKEVGNNKVIDATNKFDFIHLCALLKHINIFISNDTGPMHLSSLFNKKTIGLFGPNTPLLFGALGGRNIYHKESCPFSPCIVPHEGKFPSCKDPKCMKAISVEEVARIVEDMLYDSSILGAK